MRKTHKAKLEATKEHEHLDPETAQKVLTADVANLLRKVESGKPLTKHERDLLEEESQQHAKPNEGAPQEQDYSVNSLSKLLGADRRTIDKALAGAGVKPNRTAGRTRFYRLADAQAALVARSHPELRQLKADELRVRVARMQLKLDTERGLLTETRLLVDEVGPMLSAFRDLVYTKFENEAPVAMSAIGVAEARIVGRRMAGELLTKLQGCFRNLKA